MMLLTQPTVEKTLTEKDNKYPQQLDIDGYHPKATELLISILKKPVKYEICPYQDIDEIMEWLDS